MNNFYKYKNLLLSFLRTLETLNYHQSNLGGKVSTQLKKLKLTDIFLNKENRFSVINEYFYPKRVYRKKKIFVQQKLSFNKSFTANSLCPNFHKHRVNQQFLNAL